jgi:hypothetical protein
MNSEYILEEVGDRQYCNGVDVMDQLNNYNPDEWARLPYKLKGEIYCKKWDRGGGGVCGRGCGRGQGRSSSSAASLTSQMQAMQATIAALTTGTDDMSTLTDLLTSPVKPQLPLASHIRALPQSQPSKRPFQLAHWSGG